RDGLVLQPQEPAARLPEDRRLLHAQPRARYGQSGDGGGDDQARPHTQLQGDRRAGGGRERGRGRAPDGRRLSPGIRHRAAGAAVELGVRAEEPLAAAPAAEGAGALLFIQRAAAGALGAVRPQHPVGLGRELPPPLLVGLLDREMLALGTRHSSGTRSSATMLMILISGLMAGPAVSLQGSPTVSPVTAALCASDPLPPKCPSSM